MYQTIRITLLKFFTKKTNYCKLYVFNKKNLFLSPGIILRFLKFSKNKALKKHKKIWIGTIKALKILISRPIILFFQNLFGMRLSLFEKILKKKFFITWIFIKLFYLNYTILIKKHRRIKRWLRKRHYRLGIAENK